MRSVSVVKIVVSDVESRIDVHVLVGTSDMMVVTTGRRSTL